MQEVKVLVMPLGEIAVVNVKFFNQSEAYKETIDNIKEHVNLTFVSEKGRKESLDKETVYKINREDVRFQIFPSGELRLSFKGGLTLRSDVPLETIELLKGKIKEVKIMVSHEEFDTSQEEGTPFHEVIIIEGIR